MNFSFLKKRDNESLWLNVIFSARVGCGAAIILWSVLLASCTYGPPQISIVIKNVRAQPDSHIVAVSVQYRQFRAPTGINTFPNGGVSKILDEKAKIYMCDIDTLEIEKVASISPPNSIKIGWEPWILGWANGRLFFKMTGQAGTRLKDFQNRKKVVYQVGTNNNVSEVIEPPENIVFQHNTGPLPKGVFVRVSKGHDVIDIKTEKSMIWQTLFKTENTNGELVLAR